MPADYGTIKLMISICLPVTMIAEISVKGNGNRLSCDKRHAHDSRMVNL